MAQPDIDSQVASDAPLPKGLTLQSLALAAPKGQTAYSNSMGYYTGYDVGADFLRLPNTYFENQNQGLWCWIAVASTLGNFYAQGYRYSQAYLYNRIMNTSCNVAPGTAAPYSTCNMPGDATVSMINVGIYSQTAIDSPGLTPLLGELYEGRPFVVVLEMQVRPSGDWYLHCVVIDAAFVLNGYSYWNVCDPIEGVNLVRVSVFPQGYPGRWGNSAWYLTMFSKQPAS
ncbi:hypothetical protein [Bordetella genomosp. 11]|uniref:Peptidase C39-like domain-containing protein n=1 Tax=Bordetella genomosp. 11 TaxID=1416808 RepID=A0A261UF61_9BORD|nr:hypothetical protein [Bordetella genomosp. 11]OZI60579.1 hypothetical protein CAL28_14355 [Bordetella genomosp. 11]